MASLTGKQKKIAQRANLLLNAHDTDSFIKAILKPAKPGPVLRNAVSHYQQTVGR